jgi:hypothetical protein
MVSPSRGKAPRGVQGQVQGVLVEDPESLVEEKGVRPHVLAGQAAKPQGQADDEGLPAREVLDGEAQERRGARAILIGVGPFLAADDVGARKRWPPGPLKPRFGPPLVCITRFG